MLPTFALTRRSPLCRFVVAASMPTQGEQWESGTPAVCSGWGSTQFNGPAPDVLQWLDMGVLSDTECQDLFDADTSTSYPEVDGETMICALAPGKTPCHGNNWTTVSRALFHKMGF